MRALVPLFVLLETLLKHGVAPFGGDSNKARLSLAGAIVVGFYAAWFALRSQWAARPILRCIRAATAGNASPRGAAELKRQAA